MSMSYHTHVYIFITTQSVLMWRKELQKDWILFMSIAKNVKYSKCSVSSLNSTLIMSFNSNVITYHNYSLIHPCLLFVTWKICPWIIMIWLYIRSVLADFESPPSFTLKKTCYYWFYCSHLGWGVQLHGKFSTFKYKRRICRMSSPGELKMYDFQFEGLGMKLGTPSPWSSMHCYKLCKVALE
jgi:hypothetical protein